jgi:hypothetical protein
MYQRKYLIGKLKTRAILSIAIVVGAGVILTAVSSFSGLLQKQTSTLESEYNQLANKIQEGQFKTRFVREAKPVYEKLNLSEGKETIDRKLAINKFDALRKEYALDIAPLKVEISPIKPLSEPEFIRQHAVGIASNISLEMSTFSDEILMRVLKQMRAEIGGEIRITKFSFRRGESGAATPTNMPEVKSTVNAIWYGIKSITPTQQDPSLIDPNMDAADNPPPPAGDF